MSFAKRYWLAVVCGVLTLLGLIVGVLGLTVLAPAQQVQASAQFDRPYAITREGVLSLYADEVTVTVTAPEEQTAWVALGAANDVASWVESQSYTEIIGVENTLEDLATTAYGEAAQSGATSGDSTDSETETTDPAETTDTEDEEAQSGATSKNPLVSDMWWSPVRYGTNTVTMNLSGDQLDGAIVVATDGVGAAPSVTLTWPTPTPYYLAIFSFGFSAVLLVFTLLVSLMYVHRARRHSNSAEKRKIIDESESTDTTSIAMPEKALLEGAEGGKGAGGIEGAKGVEDATLFSPPVFDGAETGATAEADEAALTAPVAMGAAGEALAADAFTADFAAEPSSELADNAAGMGGVIDENMPEAAFTAAFDPSIVEVEVPGRVEPGFELSLESGYGQNGEAGLESGLDDALADARYADMPFTGTPAADAEFPANFDAGSGQYVDPAAAGTLPGEYPASAESQSGYTEIAPGAFSGLSHEAHSVDYRAVDYLETSPTQMGGYLLGMEAPLDSNVPAPFGADGTGAAGMVEIEMAPTMMGNIEPYPVGMEAVPLNYDYTDYNAPNQMGEMQIPDGTVVEKVSTDSGMLNMTALQAGRQFPSRRALREAKQRGVEGLIVDGKFYTTGTDAATSGGAGGQNSPQAQNETGENPHG